MNKETSMIEQYKELQDKYLELGEKHKKLLGEVIELEAKLRTVSSDLRELKDITDEDAIGLINFWMGNPEYPLTDYKVTRYESTVEVKIDNSHFVETFIIGTVRGALWCLSHPLGYKVRCDLYQYLQSRGYRLPVYFSPLPSVKDNEDEVEALKEVIKELRSALRGENRE